MPEVNRGIGQYMFQVSPVGGGFVPVAGSFAIQQTSYPQSISGTVTANGSPDTNALVALLAMIGEDAEMATVLTFNC